MLHANDENEQWAWKKFDNFTLLVHYDWPPNAPSNPSSSAGTKAVGCSTDPAKPSYVNNASGALTLGVTAEYQHGAVGVGDLHRVGLAGRAIQRTVSVSPASLRPILGHRRSPSPRPC
jgi:hypothetical protein